MATIINNQNFTLTPNQQQAVRNAAANMGLEEVIVGEQYASEDDDSFIVPIYFDSEGEDGEIIEEFAFNINRQTDLIC